MRNKEFLYVGFFGHKIYHRNLSEALSFLSASGYILAFAFSLLNIDAGRDQGLCPDVYA